ncbi:MAG: hypothetical protein ACREUC_00285 [Steroidobacteraceae bacterium]
MTPVHRALAFVLSTVSSAGCLVSSLHPVYTDAAIVFDEALLGTWVNRESEVSAIVSRGEWKSYQIAFTDRFGTSRFDGRLTTIGTARFLSVRPSDALDQPAFVVATHGFMQIESGPGRVRVREPEYAAVLSRARAGKLGVEAATDVKQNVILTARSSRLRAWLAAAVKDPALWAEWKTFTRSAE